jgi:superoxide dismutase
MKNNKELIVLFDDRGKFFHEANTLQRDIDNLKGGYDTSLLETIAKQKEGQANVDSIKKDVQAKTNTLNALRAQIEAVEQKINGNGVVKLLWEKLVTIQPADREKLKSDLRTMYFWHPVKRLGMQMIFLLPLLAVFSLVRQTPSARLAGLPVLRIRTV